MLFRLLVTTLMLVQIAGAHKNGKSLSAETFGALQADVDQHLYLTFVSHELPVQAVLVASGSGMFDPSYNYDAIGYIINRTTTPVYSVTLFLTFTRYFSLSPPQLETDTFTATVSPFFSATLPGQVNPFYYTAHVGGNHMWIKFDDVRVISQADSTPNDPTYVALDASQWITGVQSSFGDRPIITGTLRNTSHMRVQDARVVIMYKYEPTGTSYIICPWVQAALLTTTLQPGESTTYSAYNCGIGTPLPVAQGLAAS